MRRIVDSHVHVWNRAEEPQDWIDPVTMSEIDRDFSLDDLEAVLAAEGVSSAVVVQAVNSSRETERLLTARLGGAIGGVVGWCDLTAPDVRETLDVLMSLPNGDRLVGIRHLVHLEADAQWLGRPDVARGLDAIADASLVFDLVVMPHQLSSCVRVVAEHPELSFVLDHLGKPPLRSGDIHEWATDFTALAGLPNVTAKVSGLTMEADWKHWTLGDLSGALDAALSAFGPDRLMFGSDWPLVRTTGGYATWLDTALSYFGSLSEPEQDALFSGTASRVYRLSHGINA